MQGDSPTPSAPFVPLARRGVHVDAVRLTRFLRFLGMPKSVQTQANRTPVDSGPAGIIDWI